CRYSKSVRIYEIVGEDCQATIDKYKHSFAHYEKTIVTCKCSLINAVMAIPKNDDVRNSLNIVILSTHGIVNHSQVFKEEG
ncbi:hypothetical protein PENTCL1PPCAC_1633, partial [Pristionchus entomophagus]